MTLEADLKQCLSLSGSISISLDARGLWQVNVRNTDMHSYSVEVKADPFAAIAAIAGRIEPVDLPSYDLFEAAARRREGSDGYNAAIERTNRPAPKKLKPDLDLKARKAVEATAQFDDLLG